MAFGGSRYVLCPVFTMLSSVCVLYLLGTCYLLGVSAMPLGPNVVASFFENPIVEDREAMLHCAVPVPPKDYVIDVVYGSKLLVRHDEVQPQTGMDISLSSDGNTLILKIAGIKREHIGVYTCRVLIPETGGAWRTVGASSTVLDVHYFSKPPRCNLQSMFRGLILENGDLIRATCTTNPGNPAVNIQWTKILTSGAITTVSASYGMTSSSVFSQLQTNFSSTENDVVYKCTVTSPAFPNAADNTCSIGPFKTLPTEPPTTPKKIPPQVEDSTFDIPTSDGPEVRIGTNPDMGTPAIVSIVVVLLIVTLCTFLFLLYRCRKVSAAKHYNENGLPVKGMAVPATKPSQQQKPEIKQTFKKKSFTVMAEVMAPKKGKFYPPPPAYPTPVEQQVINQKILVSNQDFNKLEVMSVSSWGDILDSPTGTHSGDQFASDGDGLVQHVSKTDSFKKMFSAHYYGNIVETRNKPAVYADVIKPQAKTSRDSVISQTSICSSSPLYASIDMSQT